MTLDSMKFYIVVPRAATNYVTNPTPYLATTGYTASVGTIALTDDVSRRGPGCIEVTPTTALSGVYFGTVDVVNNQDYAFSVDVKGETGKAMRIRVEDAGATHTYETEFTATGNWQRVSVEFTAEETADDYRLYVLRDATTGTNVFYVDGFQFEDNEETTFFSGDTQGFDTGRLEFGWNGTPRASTSFRTANTYAGGVLVDIEDYAYKIITAYGLGAGNYQQLLTPLISGGSYYQGFIRKERNWSLLLQYHKSKTGSLQSDRYNVLKNVMPVGQEMVVRYQGLDSDGDEATEPIDIICVPQPSHQNTPDNPLNQRDILNFTIPSGVLDGAYKEGVELGTSESIANANRIIQQDLETGQWSDVGGGTNGNVYAIVESPNGDVYIGGAFTLAGGVANTAYVARWDGTNWHPLETGLNNTCHTLAFAPNGDLYAGGQFTSASGVANTSRIARWDGAAWSALGTGLNNWCEVLTLAPNGDLYAGGSFTLASGVANTSRIARWDGTNWHALGTGLNNTCFALAFAPNGDLYAGGFFTEAGGAPAGYIAKWDGTSWSVLGAGFNSSCFVITFSLDGDLYAGGEFTLAGGSTANRIAKWNNTSWSALGTGLNDVCRTLIFTSNGSLYAGGDFSQAGDIYTLDGVALWRAGAWRPLTVDLPGTPSVFDIMVHHSRMFLGYITTGTAIANDITNLTVSSKVNAFPSVYINGPGVLQSVTNYTSGKQIQFNGLTLLAGETLKMVLDPINLSITTDWRGDVGRYVIPGSDRGNFYLQPGANSIGVFMPSGTTAATKAYIEYTPRFDGIEGALHE